MGYDSGNAAMCCIYCFSFSRRADGKRKVMVIDCIGLGFSITVIYFVVELFSISPANGFVGIGISLVVTLICLAAAYCAKGEKADL